MNSAGRVIFGDDRGNCQVRGGGVGFAGVQRGTIMTQDDGGYEMKPLEKPPGAPADESANRQTGEPAGAGGASSAEAADAGGTPKPGEPGWVPPEPVVEKADDAEEEGADQDVEKNKGMAVLGYVFFLVPLVAAPNSNFARYHANQGLLLFILLMLVCVAVALLQGALWLTGWALASIQVLRAFFSCAFWVLQPALLLAWLALMVTGIINAANGLKKPLPVVGQWTLIK
jgi:uncharacterized membrane protein